MTRTDVTTAVNARLVPIVEYGPDPRGLGMFRRLSAVLQRGHRGQDGTRVLPRWGEWNGYAAAPQQFTGMAPLGVARPVTDRTSELGDERSSQLNDSALSVFANRVRRGR